VDRTWWIWVSAPLAAKFQCGAALARIVRDNDDRAHIEEAVNQDRAMQ
jgi:hypothetical protein